MSLYTPSCNFHTATPPVLLYVPSVSRLSFVFSVPCEPCCGGVGPVSHAVEVSAPEEAAMVFPTPSNTDPSAEARMESRIEARVDEPTSAHLYLPHPCVSLRHPMVRVLHAGSADGASPWRRGSSCWGTGGELQGLVGRVRKRARVHGRVRE